MAISFGHDDDVTTQVLALPIDRLYDLYVTVAERDHEFRVQSQYGHTPPPPGHCLFRPLGRATFTQRVLHYDSLPGDVGAALRKRLVRQSIAYRVDLRVFMSETASAQAA